MATPSNAIVTLRGGLVVRIAALELLLALEERGCVLCLEQDGTLFVGPRRVRNGGRCGADSSAPRRFAGARRLLREAAMKETQMSASTDRPRGF